MPQPNNLQLDDLLSNPRETLEVEVKCWVDLSQNDHRAIIAKEIIALANNGGGFLVIGYDEQEDGTFIEGADAPSNLVQWASDEIHSIIAKYIDPAIQCEVAHRGAPSGTKHPIIIVPGGHRVPLRAKAGSPDGKLVANRTYIRRAGPNSEEPRTSEEWDRFLERLMQNRRSELLEAMRSIMEGIVPTARTLVTESPNLAQQLTNFEDEAIERWQKRIASLPSSAPPRLINGYYDVAFRIDGIPTKLTLADLRDLIARNVRNHSGWPPFITLGRRPFQALAVDGAVEMWVGPDSDGSYDKPAHHDFWRAAPEGFLFTRRGYPEDGGFSDRTPGTTFDITTATWRLGEAILEAIYIAQALKADGNILCHAKWIGLSGRELVSFGNSNRTVFGHYSSEQSEFEITQAFSIVSGQDALPEIVWTMLTGLYELFGFYKLPKVLVSQELTIMRNQQFG